MVNKEKTRREQFDRFKEAARQLETVDDDERFEERLKQIVKQKPILRKDDNEERSHDDD